MTSTYRDDAEALRARIEGLEARLAERDEELAALREKLASQEGVFEALRGVVAERPRSSGRGVYVLGGVLVGAVALGIAARVGGAIFARSAHAVPPSHPSSVVAPAAPDSLPPREPFLTPVTATTDPCERLGVRLTLAGADAEAPARGASDLAGHKYRRGGDRSPWFSVHGQSEGRRSGLYVHGVGGFLAGDVGTTELTLFTIMAAGESGGYTLAHGGRSLLEVRGADDKRVWGRFEADVSKVKEPWSPAPFGADVLRVRGTFCLPRRAPDPSDTGP